MNCAGTAANSGDRGAGITSRMKVHLALMRAEYENSAAINVDMNGDPGTRIGAIQASVDPRGRQAKPFWPLSPRGFPGTGAVTGQMMRRKSRAAVAGALLALAVPLVPAAAFVTAGYPAQAGAPCVAVVSGTVPARGYLQDPAGLESGNFWWRASDDGSRICGGIVQMWTDYPRRENAELLAGIYRGPVLVAVIADRDYVMGAGWHSRQFTIGPSTGGRSICVGVRFGQGATGPLVRSCAQPG
jgi:hypothetical protein